MLLHAKYMQYTIAALHAHAVINGSIASGFNHQCTFKQRIGEIDLCFDQIIIISMFASTVLIRGHLWMPCLR